VRAPRLPRRRARRERARRPAEVTVTPAAPVDLVPAEVVIPLGCALTSEEITRVLTALHVAKGHGNAEVTFTFHRVGDTTMLVKDRTLLKD
jgi:hypothetical protein